MDDGVDAELPSWLDEPVDPQDFDNPADYMAALLADLATRAAGPRLVAGLDEVHAALLSPNDAVTYVQQWERASAWVAGMQATAAAAAFEVLTGNAVAEPSGSARLSPIHSASARQGAPR